MSRFLDRYLPATERRTALWLAFGGTVVTLASARVASMARQSAMTATLAAGSTPQWTPSLIAAVVQLSLVAVLVAVLIRFARAPKALALYLALGAGVSVALSVLGLPAGYLGQKAIAATIPLDVGRPSLEGWWIASVQGALGELALGVGALAGAWIAATVSLARIRDAGFSGDEPNGRGLRSKPEAMGWRFVGWEGRPASGDALVALAFVAVELLLGLAGIVLNIAYLLVPGSVEYEAARYAMHAVQLGLSAGFALAWLLAAWVVTRRSGVASLWLLPVSALPQALWFAVRGSLASSGGSLGADGLLTSAMNVLSPVAVLLAALAGTELGLRSRPATLADTTDTQDPGAEPPAPDDTAGG